MLGSIATLINVVGYVTGAALYALLLFMVVGETTTPHKQSKEKSVDWLPLLAACSGIVWNVGSLAVWSLESFSGQTLWTPLLTAGAFAALGFLPAVVVHSVLRQSNNLQTEPIGLALAVTAYVLSAAAAILHFAQVWMYRTAPAHWGLHLLTLGFGVLILAVLLYTRRRAATPHWKRIGWVVALAVFAVSALHLSHHDGQQYAWWMELIGHHASLPLILAILYQDYRFALADIFLKRALTLVSLIALVATLQQFVVWPLLQARINREQTNAFTFGVLLSLWVVTALLTPLIWQAAKWFVDTIVLQRTDYEAVRANIAAQIASLETPEAVLSAVSEQLKHALTARAASWETIAGDTDQLEDSAASLLPLVEKEKAKPRASLAFPRQASEAATTASVLVPTSDGVQYKLFIGELAGGRRLLSDDLALLTHAGMLAARRLDALRVTHERCARDLHEQAMQQLATEAELRALRAQINPHFLFNALTTIGYLIQTAPDKALDTLMRLTSLLRGVLRRTGGEFVTLNEELGLIEAYLDIERARFEDRLRVLIDVPENLRGIRVPALLIQPLVENAIKHGISPARSGGEVVVLARLHEDNPEMLQVWVRDTGMGVGEAALQNGRQRGVGLASIEHRLRAHYGAAAKFDLRSAPGVGTTVELSFPLTANAGETGARQNVADFAVEAAKRRQA